MKPHGIERHYKDVVYNEDYSICYEPLHNDGKSLKELIFHENTKIIKKSELEIGGKIFRPFNELPRLQKIESVNYIVINELEFYKNTHLKEVNLKIREVPEQAFAHCGKDTKNGMDVKLVNTIEIDVAAFAFCYLDKLELPDTLTYIANHAFRNAKFNNTELYIPEGVKFVGTDAFARTNLTDVYLPDTVTFLGEVSSEHFGLRIHMSPKLVNEIEFRNPKDRTRYVVVDDINNNSVDNLINKMTFKEINDKYLNEGIKR